MSEEQYEALMDELRRIRLLLELQATGQRKCAQANCYEPAEVFRGEQRLYCKPHCIEVFGS
jgi:hypothetical protein